MCYIASPNVLNLSLFCGYLHTSRKMTSFRHFEALLCFRVSGSTFSVKRIFSKYSRSSSAACRLFHLFLTFDSGLGQLGVRVQQKSSYHTKFD